MLFGKADAQPFQWLVERGEVVRHRAIQRSGVLRIVSGDGPEQQRGVLAAAACYFLWGLVPIFWKQLADIKSGKNAEQKPATTPAPAVKPAATPAPKKVK
mgnify:CR=1 FL=1